MKDLFFKASMLSVVAVAVAFYFYGDRDKKEPPRTPAEPAVDTSEPQVPEPTPSPSAPAPPPGEALSVQDKSSQEENESLPHWKSAFSSYEVPVGSLIEEVGRLLKVMEDDPSGRSEYELFYISEYCDRAPKNEEEFRELYSLYEESSLLHGDNNGQVMRNVRRATVHYEECKEFAQLGLPDTYDYLKAASEKGYPRAKTAMATLYKPKEFEVWSEERKEQYREEMTKNLEEARASCEPRAFHAFAYGLGEGELWEDGNEIPADVRKYSNLLGFGMIYANKSSGAEQVLSGNRARLRSLSKNMTEYDVQEAEKYGRYLYDTYCD